MHKFLENKSIAKSAGEFARLVLSRAVHSIAETRTIQLITDPTSRSPRPSNITERIPHALQCWFCQSESTPGFFDSAAHLLDTVALESDKWSSPVDMPRIVSVDSHTMLLAVCCPLAVVRTFAGWHAGQSEVEQAGIQLSRWIEQDPLLARQAVLHAALIYCKTREKPSQTFYESTTFLMAVLTLWAYGRLFSPSIPSDSITATFGSFDYPTARLGTAFDSEQGRQWINEGHRMRGHLQGVGNIWADEGPRLILRQAIQTLNTMGSWGISQRYAQALDRLDCSKIAREATST